MIKILSIIEKANPIFKIYKQNDAVECFMTLLSVLSEELNEKLPREKIEINYEKDT
jgi:ubiquitin C-terminal hydrolase